MKHTADMDRHCIDLTCLSSREQLSALMDGVLPEDQTRFLLRRLRHDAELAACWERWRMAGDVMRGAVPARRLPAEFSMRVTAALRGEDIPTAAPAAKRRSMQWAGGAALVAVLAVLTLVRWPLLPAATGHGSASEHMPVSAPALRAMARSEAAAGVPTGTRTATEMPAATIPAPAPAQVAAAMPKDGVTQRPARPPRQGMPVSDSAVVNVAQSLPATEGEGSFLESSRPWPRRVLPQYGAQGGLLVDFGTGAKPATGWTATPQALSTLPAWVPRLEAQTPAEPQPDVTAPAQP